MGYYGNIVTKNTYDSLNRLTDGNAVGGKTTYGKNLLGHYMEETGCTIYTYRNGLIS